MSTKADKGFSAVLKELDSRSVRVFEGRLPWPYNGMVHDITGAIQKRCNYLAAMGLAAYTEICGRQIVYRGKEKSDEECFNAFIEYMGIGEVLHWRIQYEGHPKRVKDAVRNGLVHQYFMKSPDSTVVMISSNSEAKRLGFILDPNSHLVMVVVPFFKLFCNGLHRAESEGKLVWHP